MKSFFAVGGFVLLTACSTTKNTTTDVASSNRGRSNTETTVKATTSSSESSRISRNQTTRPKRDNEAREAEEIETLNRMYSDLEMSSDQISRFEKEWESSVNSWKRSHGNKEMNNYERIEYQDRILRDILTDSQFNSYQEWVRENADN